MYSTWTAVEWQTPMEHDFGTLQHNEPQTYDFIFTNITEDPILIDNVRTSCGCTASEWTLEPILPDSSSYIRIEYDAERKGYFRKKIAVFFSGQRKADKLWVEGVVE